MDPEHRHELKQNDLQQFFLHFKQWWSKYGTYALVVILLVLVGLVVGRWVGGRQARLLTSANVALAQTTSPAGLYRVARMYPIVRSRAYLKAGNIRLREALLGSGGARDAGTEGRRDAGGTGGQAASGPQRHRLEQAAQAYQNAIEAGGAKLVVLNARFGLAAVYESLRNFEAASEQYRIIMEKAGVYKMLAGQARDQLADLSSLKTPVDFAKATEQAGQEPASDQVAEPSGAGEEAGDEPSSEQVTEPSGAASEGESPKAAAEAVGGNSKGE